MLFLGISFFVIRISTNDEYYVQKICTHACMYPQSFVMMRVFLHQRSGCMSFCNTSIGNSSKPNFVRSFDPTCKEQLAFRIVSLTSLKLAKTSTIPSENLGHKRQNTQNVYIFPQVWWNLLPPKVIRFPPKHAHIPLTIPHSGERLWPCIFNPHQAWISLQDYERSDAGQFLRRRTALP